MPFFAVKECTLKACQSWRVGNKCVRDGAYIPAYLKYLANMHDGSICKIRKQLDKYRLEQILEK